jgi:ribosome-binding protein aMBF1 (putative translation factor)
MEPTTDRRKRPRRGQTAEEEVAELRAEVARLRSEIRALKGQASRAPKGQAAGGPRLPRRGADGNYPAAETLRAILAQQLVRRREAAGWTQAELARRAGVRQETVSRLEGGKNAPNVATVDKLDRALQEAGV